MKEAEKKNNAETQALNIPADVISHLSFHVHEDIEEAAKWYKIPLALYSSYDIYIMQEDRCVFVGSGEAAISWMKRNEGKICPSRFPLNGL